MSAEMFNLPVLGNVRIHNIYEFYDRPIIFSVRSEAGFYILSLTSSNKSSDTWISIPCNYERLALIENGRVSLREAILSAADRSSILFTTYADSVEVDFEILSKSDIRESYLPSSKYYINIHNPDDSYTHVPTLGEIAGVTLVNLKLKAEDHPKSTIPAKALGNFLQNFQELLDSVAMNLLGNLNQRGRIPSSIMSQTSLEYASGFNSSVGITLISNSEPLLSNGILARSLETAGSLIQAKGNISDITYYTEEENIQISDRSLIKLKGILISLANSNYGLEFEWSDKAGRSGHYSASYSEVVSSLHEINKHIKSSDRIIVILGTFSSGDIDTHRFKIRDLESGVQYSGYSEEAMSDLGIPIQLGEIYRAVLRETLSVNDVTGQESYNYSLIGLRPGT